MHQLTTTGWLSSGIARNAAYLDPGSGSFVLQLVLAGLLGLLFALRTYWTKIKSGVRRLIIGEQEDDDDATN